MVGVDAGRQGMPIPGRVDLVSFVEDGRDGRVIPAQFGKLIEVLAAVAREDDAVGRCLLDPREEDPLVS